MIGSRAWVGELPAERLGELRNAAGQTYPEAGRSFGVDTGRLANSINSYLNANEGESFVVAGRGLARYAPMLEFGTRKMRPRVPMRQCAWVRPLSGSFSSSPVATLVSLGTAVSAAVSVSASGVGAIAGHT